MTLPPSFPPPARPDLADRLLASVAERDQLMAERLVQQWVHRRGLAALDALIAGPLLASQGPEAVQWLQQRAGAVSPAVEPEPQWLTGSGEQVISPSAWQEPAFPELQELPAASPIPASDPVPSALHSPAWPQLSVLPDGEPAPTPRALAPLRAWLPDADLLPLAS